jgi:hypothetical protein
MRLLGLDATPTELRIVRAERRFGATRLVDCVRLPCATAEARHAALDRALAWRPTTIVAAVPLARTAHRLLTLPFRDARRIRETVALELVGQLPADPGDLAAGHLVVEHGPTGSRVLAAVARAAALRELCATLEQAGAAPHRIDVALVGAWHLVDSTQVSDGALVLADGDRSAVAVRRDGCVAGVRALATDPRTDGPRFVREVAWVLEALGAAPHVVVLGGDAGARVIDDIASVTGRRVVRLADVTTSAWRGDDMAACAVAAAPLAGAGLTLHEAGEVEGRRGSRVAALAAVAALVAVVDVGLVRWHLARQDAALRAAIEATAAAVLPPGTRVVAPRLQLEAAAGANDAHAATPGQLLGLLRELSDRLPAQVRIALDELALDGDVLRLRGRTDRYETIDVVTRALAGAAGLRDVAAEESRAAIDGRGVDFAVRATWRPVVGAPS